MIKQNEKLDWNNYSETEKQALSKALGEKEPEKAFLALWATLGTQIDIVVSTASIESYDYLQALANDCHYLAKWLLQCTPKGNYNTTDDILATLTAEELQQDLMKFTAVNFIVYNLGNLQNAAEQRLAELEQEIITGGDNGQLH